jgi:DNA-binding LytR/AlgR family response regulator
MFMMIIIDDDPKMLEKLKHALEAHHIKSIFTFTSTKNCSPELISKASLIFLDIEMPDDNGMEFAKRIRKNDADKKIIFISSHEQYVFDSFAAQPFYFIRKTDFENDFAKAMQMYRDDLKRNKKFFLVKQEGKLKKIEYSSIMYAEKYKNNVLLYLNDGSQIILSKSLKTLMDELDDGFVLINRSVIVNLYYLTKIEDIYVNMADGNRLEISRRKRSHVTETLHKYVKG